MTDRAVAWWLTQAVVGLLWFGALEDSGWLAWWLGAVPASLLVASGVAGITLPGDARTPQLGALGGALGIPIALLLCLSQGLWGGLFLALVSALGFIAAGAASYRGERPTARVPSPPLDLSLALKVGIDEVVLGSIVALRPTLYGGETDRHARELLALEELGEARGWIDQPESYHREPPLLAEPDLRRDAVGGIQLERVRFASDYEPGADEPGRERWLDQVRNRTAHARWLPASDASRPWLIAIHGYGMGFDRIDLGAFEAQEIRRQLDLNVLLPVLPLHGPRRRKLRSGDGFITGDFADTLHAAAQTAWDLRRLLGWVRSHQPERVGLYGLSLGGYASALLTSLSDGVDLAILGIPAADLAGIAARQAPPSAWRRIEALGAGLETARRVLRPVSPLVLEPRVPHDARYMFAANADRLVPAAHVRDLWLHWKEPRIAWYAGSHLSFNREREVHSVLDDALGRLAGRG